MALTKYSVMREIMKKRILSVFVLLIVTLFPAVSLAGKGSGKVKIQHVGGFGNGSLVFFYTTTHSVVDGSCNGAIRWTLDLASAAGKEQYSLLLAAQMSGSDVVVSGNDICSNWPGSEDVYYVGLSFIFKFGLNGLGAASAGKTTS
mgnify:CR=1 FL=1